MKLIISILFSLIILNSCTLNYNKQIINSLSEKKDNFVKKIEKKKIEKKKIEQRNIKQENKKLIKLNPSVPFYLVGELYFIDGVQYIPQENYNYSKNGLATFYGKELHNHKTANNDLNKVTELLGRHKTLPLPSVVKVTNLENGLSLVIKVNDRHKNNASIIEVSRKVAQLLGFYKEKIARVRVEIIVDPSKQQKIVTNSMNDPNFESTIKSSPSENVLISDLGEITDNSNEYIGNIEHPIELGFEEVLENNLFIKIDGFKSYNNTQDIISLLDEDNYNITIQNEGTNYSATLGPFNNIEANKLVQFFIGKGYKNIDILIK